MIVQMRNGVGVSLLHFNIYAKRGVICVNLLEVNEKIYSIYIVGVNKDTKEEKCI